MKRNREQRRKGNGKVKFFLRPAMKAERRSTDTALFFP